jgi:hypothetical protein
MAIQLVSMKKITIILSVVLAFALFSFIVYAIGSPPSIYVKITDTNQDFDVTVQGHKVKADYGVAQDPDVIIKLSTQTLADLYSADDFHAAAVEQYRKGNIHIEIKADYATLALKGYKAILDEFEKAVK